MQADAVQMKEKIRSLSEAYFEETLSVRRHLHQYPELSFEERETSAYIQAKCREYGLSYRSGIAGTGVVAEIEGAHPGPLVAIRADIDALPIQERNEVSYSSQRPGVMHACGHDVHTATVLTAARVLHELRGGLRGSVRVIFQPGEEKLPGGASLMIREGVLENPRPVAIFGNHVHPPLEAGTVGYRAGRYMASADELYLTIRGSGGHAALPHETVDTVAAAAQVVVALQQLVSRKADPLIPSVLSFGKIQTAGGATNVIPNEVRLEGTFRTLDESWRVKAHEWMERIAHQTCMAFGATADFEIRKGYPCLDNDEALSQRAGSWLAELLGAGSVEELPQRMTAEDFAYYSHELPAFFYRLGTGNKARGITSAIHTDRFDIDEDVLRLSPAIMAWLAYRACGSMG